MKVAVLGAGIVGTAVAWRLAEAGADVLVVDVSQPGAAATGASLAWANASSAASEDYFALRVAGLDEHRLISKQLQGDWTLASGHLQWADTQPETEALRDRYTRLRSRGYPAELLNPAEASASLEPSVRFAGPEHPVLHTPDEPAIDAPAMARRLLRAAVTCGAVPALGKPVRSLTVRGGRVAAVVVGDTSHGVDAVINAAGANAHHLADMAGRRLPLRDEPGLVARLYCDPVPVRHTMHAPGIEIRPDGPRQVLLHSRAVDAQLSPDGYPHDQHIDDLCRRAADIVPELAAAELRDARVGWRPVPQDGWPSVGGLASIPGYYEAVTHSGVTLAGIIAKLLTEEILTGTVHPLLAPFRPDRDGLRPTHT
ncbi:FAD-dependent oxidoreductase [Streptomyces sp. NPDC001508]|uniref:NAD(P)/FAD-dependent oxidoreductase n=1 Tax=Streptomyces sp. NPDC001508 TaxID=3154656 RepID=UPI00332ECA21